MKLKITEPGWEGFTGDFGGIDFADGVSTVDVAPYQAKRLSNAIRCETLEGLNPSSSQQVIDSRCVQVVAAVVAPEAPTVKVWTRDQLQALADTDGIKGIRTISDPLDIKSTSISALIDAIVNAQAPPVVVEPTVVAEPAAGVINEPETLLGSSVQPSTFEFAPGVVTTLGDVVCGAFKVSGLTVADWNETATEVREQFIAEEVARLQTP